MFCKKCGAQIANNAEFCTACESKVEEDKTSSRSIEAAQKSKVKVIVGALLAIAGGASIIYGISEFDQAAYFREHFINMGDAAKSHTDIGTAFVVIGSILVLIGSIMQIFGIKKKK